MWLVAVIQVFAVGVVVVQVIWLVVWVRLILQARQAQMVFVQLRQQVFCPVSAVIEL